MAGDRLVSFPVAALGMLAFFFPAALLTNHAFDVLRLSESEAVKERPLSEPPVEARLWEDPLAAVVRLQDRRRALCRGAPQCPPEVKYAAKFPDEDIANLPMERLSVVAALVPGASFVGLEESRRRTRYAVLSGLASQGFVPERGELLGLWNARVCSSADCPKGKHEDGSPTSFDIPYETFRTEVPESNRRVIVLWLDDSKLGKAWFSKVTALLDGAFKSARISVLGPDTSDKLADALDEWRDLARALEPSDSSFCRYWSWHNRVELISPNSTAYNRQLIRAASSRGESQKDEKQLAICGHHFSLQNSDPVQRSSAAPFFIPTIGPDAVQIELLREELCARGLGDGRGGRIVILREWDSIYARSFARDLGKELECRTGAARDEPPPPGRDRARFDVYSYLGGIDGITLEGTSKQQRLVPRAGGDKKREESKEPDVEWPENRDQRDYIRRLVIRLQREAELSRRDAVRAVGIIGQDVHDKLMLLQAMRPAFPERMIFTTDLDARFLHPDVEKYARNLVVASALPLSPTDLVPPIAQSVKMAPFRDIYQTAAFLGARYAALPSEPAQLKEEKAVIASHLQTVHLYEIGRSGEVKLATRGYQIASENRVNLNDAVLSADQLEDRRFCAGLSFIALALLGVIMVLVKPGLAMREAVAGIHARQWSSLVPPDTAQRESVTNTMPLRYSTMFLSGITVGSWGFAAGVVGELALPGIVGLWGAVAVAVTTMMLFWISIYPGPQPSVATVAAGTARHWTMEQRLLRGTLFVMCAAAVLLWMPRPGNGAQEPFALFSGVSGWPSELLCALAVLLFGWFLDFTWRGTAVNTLDVGWEYFGVKDIPKTHLNGLPAQFRPLWLWRPQIARRKNAKSMPNFQSESRELTGESPELYGDGSINGTPVWRRYIRLLHGGPRFLRLLLSLFVVSLFVCLEVKLFGGETPDVPARGLEDRSLFYATVWMAVAATVILMVLVSDATILTWRFIQILGNNRTIYPPETIERFAARLGPELKECAALRIAAHARDRGGANQPRNFIIDPSGTPLAPTSRAADQPRNSIIDPWIDARLLADHTAAISQLIFFPLILLGLLFLARHTVFDNWAINGVVTVVLVTYLLWTIAMATMLNISAERARRTALDTMRRDLLWLQGSDKKYEPLAKQFPLLIKQVEDLRKGAFAPFFEQPLVQAVLVPLGGAGGLELLKLLSTLK